MRPPKHSIKATGCPEFSSWRCTTYLVGGRRGSEVGRPLAPARWEILSWTLFCSKSQLRPKGLTWFSLGRCMDAQCYTLDTVRRWYHRKNWWQWGWIKKGAGLREGGKRGGGWPGEESKSEDGPKCRIHPKPLTQHSDKTLFTQHTFNPLPTAMLEVEMVFVAWPDICKDANCWHCVV